MPWAAAAFVCAAGASCGAARRPFSAAAASFTVPPPPLNTIGARFLRNARLLQDCRVPSWCHGGPLQRCRGLRWCCHCPHQRCRGLLQHCRALTEGALSHSANYYVVYPGNTPETHPPAEACMIHSKPHWGCIIQENSRLFAHRMFCTSVFLLLRILCLHRTPPRNHVTRTTLPIGTDGSRAAKSVVPLHYTTFVKAKGLPGNYSPTTPRPRPCKPFSTTSNA